MTAGRHRSPPPAKPPDYTIPLGIAAGVLTAASLVAIAATAVAPDASAAARDGVTVSTASRSARTVHVPVTILPAPVPSIGAEGAWDPGAAPTSMFAGATATASAPAHRTEITLTGTRSPSGASQPVTEALTATTAATPTTVPRPVTSTTTSSATRTTETVSATTSETAASTSTTTSAASTTEETTTPTIEAIPTDILGGLGE